MDRLSFLKKFIWMYVCIYELCMCVWVCIYARQALKNVQKDTKESGDLCSSPYPAVDLAG